MDARELFERYEFNVSFSYEQILNIILGHMRQDEQEYYLSVLDDVASQMMEHMINQSERGD